MRKQMVTLENKAEMLAAQLRQRIGVQASSKAAAAPHESPLYRPWNPVRKF